MATPSPANTEILKLGKDKYRVCLLYTIGDGDLRIRIYASKATTIVVDAQGLHDVVRHRKGHCQFCGGRFDTDDPPAPQKPEWCTDCYERFVVNRGKFSIANLIALTGYVLRKPTRESRWVGDPRGRTAQNERA